MASISDRVGNIVGRLTDRVVSRAWTTLILSWIVAAGCIAVTSHLTIHGDFSSLLPPNTESVRHLRALEKRTLVLASYMVGIESDDPEQRAGAAAMLKEHFGKIDPRLVSGITADDDAARQFAWKNRFLFAPLAELEKAHVGFEKKIAEVDPLYLSLDDDDSTAAASTDELDKRIDDSKKEADTSGAFVSKDGRLQMLLVRTTFDAGDDKGQELNAILKGDIAEAEARFPHVKIGMAGDVISTQAEHKALVKGVLESTLATLALVVGAILLFYRSVVAVGALCWSLVVGVVATFAFTEVSIGQLNLASAFLSSIVIGNGINCGLVLLARYMEERCTEASPEAALRAAVRGAAPGTMVATLTAMVAYVSLAITPFRGFRDFGIIGAVGMALCWISAFTVLPAGLTLVGARVKGNDPAKLGAFVARVIPERPRLVTAIGFVLLGLTSLATVRYLTHDPLEDDLRNLRSDNPDLDAEGAWMGKFDKAFGNGIEGGFVIGVKDPRETKVVADKLRGVDEGKPERQHLFSRISTLDDALPKDQEKKLQVLAQIRELADTGFVRHMSPEDQAKLKKLRPPDDLRPLTYADIPAPLAWPYTERDGSRGKFVLANTGLGVDTWRTTALESFARVVRGLKLGPDVEVGGSAFVFSDMVAAMEHDGPTATFASLFGSMLVVLLVLGVGRNARITLACAALGVTGMLTAAWAMGIKVNFLDFVALPITVGIGVDYGVNMVARATQWRGASPGRHALVTTGPVVILCSYTTAVGYASLLFSQNRGIKSFGLSAMIGELTCISAAMLLAPALLDYGTTSAKSP
jgi:predicted RND superfamily exporter protein